MKEDVVTASLLVHVMWNASPDDINNDSAQDKYWGDIAEECYNMSWEGLGDTPGYGDTEGQQIVR